jgi:hypothetical protein
MCQRVLLSICLACVVAVSVSPAAADFITRDSLTDMPAVIDLTALPSNAQWMLGSGNTSLGSTAFSTAGSTLTYQDASYPLSTYTNGTSPTSATNETGTYRWQEPWSTGCFDMTIHVPQGSGQVILWIGQGTYNWGQLSADFASTPETDLFLEESALGGLLGQQKLVMNYRTDTAQDMRIVTATAGNYNNYGFFAAALVPVPEPGAMTLIGCGVISLLAYAWRKRR